MDFVANFVCFPAVQNFENRLRFDELTDSLKVGTFLRQCISYVIMLDLYFSVVHIGW